MFTAITIHKDNGRQHDHITQPFQPLVTCSTCGTLSLCHIHSLTLYQPMTHICLTSVPFFHNPACTRLYGGLILGIHTCTCTMSWFFCFFRPLLHSHAAMVNKFWGRGDPSAPPILYETLRLVKGLKQLTTIVY